MYVIKTCRSWNNLRSATWQCFAMLFNCSWSPPGSIWNRSSECDPDWAPSKVWGQESISFRNRSTFWTCAFMMSFTALLFPTQRWKMSKMSWQLGTLCTLLEHTERIDWEMLTNLRTTMHIIADIYNWYFHILHRLTHPSSVLCTIAIELTAWEECSNIQPRQSTLEAEWSRPSRLPVKYSIV